VSQLKPFKYALQRLPGNLDHERKLGIPVGRPLFDDLPVQGGSGSRAHAASPSSALFSSSTGSPIEVKTAVRVVLAPASA